MSYKAKDGKVLTSVIQGRKYDRSLAEKSGEQIDNAPGGPQHEHDLREHGMVQESHITYDGPGRWRSGLPEHAEPRLGKHAERASTHTSRV